MKNTSFVSSAFICLALTVTLGGRSAYADNNGNHNGWHKESKKHCHVGLPGAQIPPGTCAKKFTLSILPDSIKNKKIEFSISKLDVLFNQPDIVILDDVDLQIELKGKVGANQEVNIDLNGIKLSRRDGRDDLDFMEYLSKRKTSVAHFRLNKMFLNGSEPFNKFLMRIKENDGVIRIKLDAKNDVFDQIVSIKLVLTGRSFSASFCPKPPPPPPPGTNPPPPPGPPPPPPPQDPAAYKPRINSVNPAQTPTSSTAMTITFSATATDGEFYCSLDNAVASKCDSPMIYDGLADDGHIFKVYGRTPDGQSTASVSYSWFVDSIPPTVTIANASSLPNLTNGDAIAFEFVATKTGSTFICRLDAQPSAPCLSPMNYSGLNEGVHTFQVWAKDTLGTVSKLPAVFSWNIDMTPPEAAFLAVVPSDDVSNINSRSFTFSSNETANFKCASDDGVLASCLSPLKLDALTEGAHTFTVVATDLTGNTGVAISSSWSNDFTAPQVAFGSVQPQAGVTNARRVSAEFYANEISTFLCSFDGQAGASCSAPFAADVNQEGAHSLSVVAVDAAGNVSAPAQVQWVMDFSASIISFGQMSPSSSSYFSSNSFTVPVMGSDNDVLTVTVNGMAIASANPIALNGLTEGNYVLSVFSTDASGNVSNTISHEFNVDSTAPVITLDPSGPALVNSDLRTFNFSANEFVRFECNLDNSGFVSCDSPHTYAGLGEDTHSFVLRAIDLAGNSSVVNAVWTVDTTAPSTGLEMMSSSTGATFSGVSSEPNSTFMCSLDDAPFAPCPAVVSYSNLSIGQHSFVMKAVDAAGNIDPAGASYSFEVPPAIQTTIVGANPAAAFTNSRSITVTFIANQATSGFMCSLDGAMATTCNGGTISYSNLSDGTHSVNVKAIDAYGNIDFVGATYTWTVDTVAPVPSAPPLLSIGTNSVVVTWTTNEPATSQVKFGVGGTAGINQKTVETTTYKTSHSVTVVGLSSNTLYSLQVTGRDRAGNAYLGGAISFKTHR